LAGVPKTSPVVPQEAGEEGWEEANSRSDGWNEETLAGGQAAENEERRRQGEKEGQEEAERKRG
jgi:hypothetical protein